MAVEDRFVARFWFRVRKFLAQKVLHTNDTPHAIALGAAIAMLVAFLPLIGLQTMIAVGLAALCRANKAVCIPIVWITNPLTMVPIYGACLGLGRLLVVSPSDASSAAVLSDLERQQGGPLFELEFWKGVFHRLSGLGLELWIGCAVVGSILGIASYFFARWGVSNYRERRRRKILRRNLLRSNLQKGKVTRRTKAV